MAVHFPRNVNDTALFVLFWVGGVFTLVYECYYILWSYHTQWNTTIACLYAIAFYFAVIIYVSMYKIISTNVSLTSLNHATREGPTPAGWRYCELCQRNAPPRSHHCKICDECILKRDHHCWYAGYCIGFQNQRYFLCLAFHTSLAGLFANVYNWQLVMEVKGGFAWTTLPSLIAPHVGFVFGQYSTQEFIITCITSAGTLFTLFFVSLFAMQLIQMYHGQVQYERKKDIRDYSLGPRNSIKEIFGSTGLWALLCPFVNSSLPSDGTSFLRQQDKLE